MHNNIMWPAQSPLVCMSLREESVQQSVIISE